MGVEKRVGDVAVSGVGELGCKVVRAELEGVGVLGEGMGGGSSSYKGRVGGSLTIASGSWDILEA